MWFMFSLRAAGTGVDATLCDAAFSRAGWCANGNLNSLHRVCRQPYITYKGLTADYNHIVANAMLANYDGQEAIDNE